MLRRLSIIVLMLCGLQAMAQVRTDTIIDLRAVAIDMDSNEVVDDEVVSSSGYMQFTEDVPVASDSEVPVVAGEQTAEETGMCFNRYFAEATLGFGASRNDEEPLAVAVGAMFGYVPQHWGFYAAAHYGVTSSYRGLGLGAGVVARPFCQQHNLMDWQLYLGVATRQWHPGAEAGTCLALGPAINSTQFCWTSLSFGVQYSSLGLFYTIGLSVSLAALSLLSLL